MGYTIRRVEAYYKTSEARKRKAENLVNSAVKRTPSKQIGPSFNSLKEAEDWARARLDWDRQTSIVGIEEDDKGITIVIAYFIRNDDLRRIVRRRPVYDDRDNLWLTPACGI